ncbi:MAG: hypothetical protein EOO25_07060 [Comamonadaceae bacterium]|nr:MAG: hypothetical protein EOO25_07060 [Comamonadaceae bacterium]
MAVMAWLWMRWLPMPPTSLSLSAGHPDGAYFAAARRYAAKFAERGVTLTVLPSEGSAQNLLRLRGAASPQADLAFVQGGMGYPVALRGTGEAVQTIARVDVEPLWIFSRIPGLDSLQQLQGLRISMDAPGSGTRKLALELLGQVDVVIQVAAAQSPVVQSLARSPGIQLVQLRNSAALTERLPYLQPRLLPQGALDDAARLPPRDTTMLVTTSSLVARADLHPALQRLAADVARGIHASPGLFHRAGDFPSLKRIEFPASEDARRTLLRGLPWLEQELPFWWAQLVWRLLVICLPVALAAYWLARLVPAYLRWLVESRVARWYGELMYIEHELAAQEVSGLELSRHLERLNSIERRMADFITPGYLMPRWFMLRQHIDFVRMSLYRMRGR